ncbi:hypothetical protein BDK51DRAFT_42519 [Blyttiomyces helicus]|uniref:Uncharacterized protein n=1 Tax=Blyttiomyces helicus TaxID=388810 RepID=A0A4P9WMZ6_9FUNG|nr:hypothetical protein BDK51DRAFT_42519 [Blyttiomyces helicus]|eukprot:RKO93615.1 hypothetical protein BDK51DRAFT_42519 [Blyttiomyces helicus]
MNFRPQTNHYSTFELNTNIPESSTPASPPPHCPVIAPSPWKPTPTLLNILPGVTDHVHHPQQSPKAVEPGCLYSWTTSSSLSSLVSHTDRAVSNVAACGLQSNVIFVGHSVLAIHVGEGGPFSENSKDNIWVKEATGTLLQGWLEGKASRSIADLPYQESPSISGSSVPNPKLIHAAGLLPGPHPGSEKHLEAAVGGFLQEGDQREHVHDVGSCAEMITLLDVGGGACAQLTAFLNWQSSQLQGIYQSEGAEMRIW